jgi:hypothetical protein
VASTIGTIMALLVFLTIISMFTNTYIPIWMKENEKDHMEEVLGQFGDLKGKVDTLIVNAQVTKRPTINMFQPVKLGSESIPVFTSPTGGYLYLKPGNTYDTGVVVDFRYNYSGAVQVIHEEGGGCVEFYGPNRYYVQQWYAYENGALMVYQKEGMAMRATPSLVFTPNADGSVNIQFDQVDLIGRNETVAGMGTAGVVIDLIYHDSQVYSISGATGAETDGSLTITFTTRYNATMISYIDALALAAGLEKGVGKNYTLVQTVLEGGSRPIYSIALTIPRTNEFTHNRAYVNLDLEY